MLVSGFFFLLLLQLGASGKKCTDSAKLDLQIIVDSSGSVGADQFHMMMEKISKSLVSQFDIGEDKTRVALFKYSRPKVMKNEFSLSKYSDKNDLQKKIESTEYAPGWTMTAMAMEKAFKIFYKEQRKDKVTARVCLVFTDGDASDKEKVPSATQKWAKDGVIVFAIGIGKGISHDGLQTIAGDDERVLEVDNFEAIGVMAKTLLKKVCKTVEPVTTKPPKPLVTKLPKPVIKKPEPLPAASCVFGSDFVPVDFDGGSAGATSSLAKHGPSQAFELKLWKNPYLPWANLNTAKMPQTVWYKFKEALTVVKFAFSSRSHCCLEQSPLEFQFVGSGDCQNWKVIQSYKTEFTKRCQEKSWIIPKGSRNLYQCYGIKVLKVKSGVYAAIKHVKMWAEEKFIPVDYEGGSAGASSSLGRHGALQAFELKHQTGEQWRGVYLPWANLNTAKLPQTVWYKFSAPLTVAKFAFSSRSRCCLEQSPLQFQFVGSDDCKNWKVIQSLKTKFTKLSQEKSWTIPKGSRKLYQCYGIKVLKVKSGIYTAIKRVKMWAEEVFIPVDYEGGSAGASSSLARHSAYQAFELNQQTGVYLPWANLNTAKFPQTVWYKFSAPITVAKFAFSSRGRAHLQQSPIEFELVGSNDCRAWKVLGAYKTLFTKLNQEKSWMVPCKAKKEFSCYGIKVLKVQSGIYAVIKHLKMWTSSATDTLIPADFKGGEAGATSSLSGHGPNQAFELNLWKGPYHPWANLNTAKLPQTVWYKFSKAIQVAKFGFSSRGRCCLEQSPLEFEFVGSNDCKNWNVIASYNTQFTTLNQGKTWTLPPNLRKIFRCYGIKVNKVKSGIYAAIKHVKMWIQAPATF